MMAQRLARCFNKYSLERIPSLSVVNIPYSDGQPRDGVNQAFKTLKNTGLFSYLNQYKHIVYHDIPPVNVVHPDIYNQLLKIPTERKKLVIGGDHAMTIASGSAFLTQNTNAGILVIDAHADLNTPSSSPSGNIHGMTFAKLLGLGRYSWMENVPLLKPKNLAYIGLRDLDKFEIQLLEKQKIKFWTSEQVKCSSFSAVLTEALEHMSKCDKIMVSFDVDVIDPSFISGTGTPVRHGLDYFDILDGIHLINNEKVSQFEVVEFNPSLSRDSELEGNWINDIIIRAFA